MGLKLIAGPDSISACPLTWVVVSPVPSASSRFSRGDGYGLCVYQSRNTDLDFSCTEAKERVSQWSRRAVECIMHSRVPVSHLKTITGLLAVPNGARQGEFPPNAVFANST